VLWEGSHLLAVIVAYSTLSNFTRKRVAKVHQNRTSFMAVEAILCLGMSFELGMDEKGYCTFTKER
jgi:hypothetical protein